MDFGDDPLADLSDGSNDSFFDEPKRSGKRASLTKTPEKKKSVTDIFNLPEKSTESAQPPKRSDDWLGLDTKETKSPSRTQKLTKKISFEDDDDLLGNLGFSKRPASRTEVSTEENKPAKKMDLFESILGPPKNEELDKKTSFEDILKESKAKSGSKSEDAAKKSPFDDIFKDSKAKGPSASASSTPKPSLGVTDSLQFSDGPREGRRGRRTSATLMDPLGLFSNEAKQEDSATVKEKPSATAMNETFSTKAVHSKSTPNISNQGKLRYLFL